MTLPDIQTIIADVLKRLDVSFESIEIHDEDVHARLSITTADSGALIGSRGENLRALNHIVKRIVEHTSPSDEAPQFVIDVNGYQGKRIEEIRNHARVLAERARMFQYDVEMSPMNAYERMIVHATFSNEADIETQSQGEGKFRRVVIRATKKEPTAVGSPPDAERTTLS